MPTDGANDTCWGSKFLVVFAHHNMYFNMRFQELEAISGSLGVTSPTELYGGPAPTALSSSPLVLVNLRGGEVMARQICERAVLVKAVLEIWACGGSYEEAVAEALAAGETSAARRRPFLAPPKTFQIRVIAFGRTPTMEDKREIHELIRPLFVGDEICDLDNPDTTVWALEENDHRTEQKTHLGRRIAEPLKVFVARQVAGGRSIDKKLKGKDTPLQAQKKHSFNVMTFRNELY